MTIKAEDLDSSAFNIQGIGFATGLAGPLVGCRDSLADNFNVDTGGVYGTAGAVVVFNTHSDPGDPNECLYTGCMDQNSSSFFSTVYNGNTYYATTAGPCDYEGCNDPLALNYNVTCGGYVLPSGTSITITNNGCCSYPASYDCDNVNGGVLTITNGTGTYVVCDGLGLPSGCYATAVDAYAAAIAACPACGSNVVQGCTDSCAPNYDSLATCDDGSCDSVVYGCMDNGSMTAGQVNSYGNSIWPTTTCLGYACASYDSYDSSWSYVDDFGTGLELNTNLGDILSNTGANNYDVNATTMDCSCEYHGCTDPQAINYESFYTNEDGSCIYAGCIDPTSVNGVTTYNHPNPILYDNLGNIITTWYTNPIDATIDDGTCVTFGCNPIDTPNVAPWNGNPIKETMINDNAFEKAIESWNEGGINTQMVGLYYGHAEPPLEQPGVPICGIPSTFANNLNNIVDYGNGLTGTCTYTDELTHMAWEDNNGVFVYDGLSCTQGFANAWGPFDQNYWSGGDGHNDGFYLKRFGFPQLTYPAHKTIMSPIGQDITDLSGIQDFALNPAFKRLVIHNQYITSFIHSETDPSSPYYQLDMLDTLFRHAPNFDFLSLKSCSLGGSGEVLDLTNWSNCRAVELVDLGYDEVNINHINNPNCHSIFIVNDTVSLNNNGNLGANSSQRNMRASGSISSSPAGYSQDLNIDWTSHTPGTIPTPTIADKDESYRQAITCGYGYNKSGQNSISGSLVGKMYDNANDTIGEHFPPQPTGFTGWDISTGFSGDPASHFVPQYKLAPFIDDGVNYSLRDGQNLINTRRGSTNAFPEQIFISGVGSNGGSATVNYQLMWNYQGNIHGMPIGQTLSPGGSYHDGFGWVDHPSSNLLVSDPHGTEVGLLYPNPAFPNYNPPNSNIKVDLELAYPKIKRTNFSKLGTISQSQLILINLKNLRHIWLGPDWDPAYAMNTPNVQSAGANFGVPQVNPKSSVNRSFSIKGCGNGQPVYVHTDGRAMEFKKRYGTNDQAAVNQFGDPIWTPEAETFFLMYFDSNVVFID